MTCFGCKETIGFLMSESECKVTVDKEMFNLEKLHIDILTKSNKNNEMPKENLESIKRVLRNGEIRKWLPKLELQNGLPSNCGAKAIIDRLLDKKI